MIVGSNSDLADQGVQQEHKSGMMGNLGGVDMMRQVTMILALAICLALAVFVMLWAQELSIVHWVKWKLRKWFKY